MRAPALGLVVVAVVGAVVALAVFGDGEEGSGADATAPLAPPGVPARPAPAVSDEPGEGVEAEEARKVELGLPGARRFGASDPRKAVAWFMDGWHDRAWDRMAVWTTPAWRRRHHDPGAELRERFGAFRLEGWAFEDVDRRGPTAVVSVLTARRGLQPQIVRERLRLALTRPQGGRWSILLVPE